jgi:hypothetical protein
MRLKRGWMRRPTRWPDDMRKLPRRRATAPRELRSTLKRAIPHLDGTDSPSWHNEASIDRRRRRSSSADRRRPTDWRSFPDRRGNSGRRWGTTYRSRVGRTSEADAYSPSLGRGPEGGGGGRFSGSAARKQPGWLGGPPLLRGRKSFVKQDFFFRNQPFAVHNTPPSTDASLPNSCTFLNKCARPRRGGCPSPHSTTVKPAFGPTPAPGPESDRPATPARC